MKRVAIFCAILAVALAAEEKKEEKKAAEKQQDEKQVEIRQDGLQWPLPDWSNEGDLMLHGVHFYERVGELRQVKSFASDIDRMVLAVGRDFLRRTQKYLASTPDFKILPQLCRDSRAINSSERWEIRLLEEIPDIKEPAKDAQAQQPQKDAALPQEDKTHPRSTVRPVVPVNATNENVTEHVIPKKSLTIFEAQRQVYYDRMGANFARLLMKKFRKETLIQEENEYLVRWESDEAVHYGAMGIYCQQREENLNEMVKQLNTYIEEKP